MEVKIMSNNEIMKAIEEYLNLNFQMAEMKKRLEANKAKLITLLDGEEEKSFGSHVIRNKKVTSNRFDTARFKADFGDDSYLEYCKPTISFRFTIS